MLLLSLWQRKKNKMQFVDLRLNMDMYLGYRQKIERKVRVFS